MKERVRAATSVLRLVGLLGTCAWACDKPVSNVVMLCWPSIVFIIVLYAEWEIILLLDEANIGGRRRKKMIAQNLFM